jgi:hypothetical protein
VLYQLSYPYAWRRAGVEPATPPAFHRRRTSTLASFAPWRLIQFRLLPTADYFGKLSALRRIARKPEFPPEFTQRVLKHRN